MFLDIILNRTKANRAKVTHQPTIENTIEPTNISIIVKAMSHTR